MGEKRVFRVTFLQQGQVYELFVRNVSQGKLLGFVELEELLFGERSQVVVDPSEERLKTEFQGVRRIHLPLHAVLRIEEVEKEGVPRIIKSDKGEGTVSHFPVSIYTPSGDGES
jgi:hypothetical protein